jgi:hypothetical protein
LVTSNKYIPLQKNTMKPKTVKLTDALLKQLNKERLRIKPSPSLHAYMVYKLGK